MVTIRFGGPSFVTISQKNNLPKLEVLAALERELLLGLAGGAFLSNTLATLLALISNWGRSH